MRRLLASLLLIVPLPAWAAQPSQPPSSSLLFTFRAAPVGIRLAALGHEVLSVLPVQKGELAVVVYAPEQSASSKWDDESRIVLYKQASNDYERVQFVSKAGASVPGKLRKLIAQDVDGDGVDELIAIGRPHGPVGKTTIMLFKRTQLNGSFYPVFRRRQIAPAVSFGPKNTLSYTHEEAGHLRVLERYTWHEDVYDPAEPQFPPALDLN